MALVLKFLADIAQETLMKEWLGGDEASIFWPVLLRSLCSTSSAYYISSTNHGVSIINQSYCECISCTVTGGMLKVVASCIGYYVTLLNYVTLF